LIATDPTGRAAENHGLDREAAKLRADVEPLAAGSLPNGGKIMGDIRSDE
jgi:hypothetical protein